MATAHSMAFPFNSWIWTMSSRGSSRRQAACASVYPVTGSVIGPYSCSHSSDPVGPIRRVSATSSEKTDGIHAVGTPSPPQRVTADPCRPSSARPRESARDDPCAAIVSHRRVAVKSQRFVASEPADRRKGPRLCPPSATSPRRSKRVCRLDAATRNRPLFSPLPLEDAV
jgi:hypothetical protein